MPTAATTVAEYLENVSDDRRAALKTLRTTIRKNLPKGFKEVIGYGMPSYVVPHGLYPAGYHCDPKLPLPFMGFASQKSHIGLYHMGLYADPALMKWFTAEHAKRVPGKLDMGKSCVRYKKPDAIPFDLIGELCTKVTPQQWIARYEANLKR